MQQPSKTVPILLSTLVITVISSLPIVNISTIINDIFSKMGVTSNRFGLTRKILEEYRENGYSITHIITITIVYGILFPMFGIIGGLMGVIYFIRKSNSLKPKNI